MAKRSTKYREVFFAHNGPGPFSCYFCDEEVDFDRVVVHHVDGDCANDHWRNLAPAHNECNSRDGQSRAVYGDEFRAKISRAHKGKTRSPEWRAAISAGQRRRYDAARTCTDNQLREDLSMG